MSSASYDFNLPLTAESLVAEVAGGTFAFKNKVKPASVRLLWEKLGLFVAETLKQQKGVLLPALGTFRVGPVVGESNKKIRPCFNLLEGRYGAISQERPKYIIGGKAPVVQPNYGLLSTAASVHRGAGQRLIAELLQRLGVNILSQRPVKVEFPGIGKLSTNRPGRIEFVFDPLFNEFFERENTAIIKEMVYTPEDYEVHKGLQHITLEDPPVIKSPRGAASRPVSAVSGASRAPRLRQQPPPPHANCLQAVLRLCNAADRTASGCVPRLRLEHWLAQECRPSLMLLDGATLMDLLDKNTYGSKVQQILYRQFLDALDTALAAADGEAVPVSPRNGAPSSAQPTPRPQQLAVGQQLGNHKLVAAGGEEQRQTPRVSWSGEASAQDLVTQQQHQEDLMSEVDAYPHYCQNQLSPRSRADYDAFNRVHFERLHHARGGMRRVEQQRAVTPKVGEEILNVQEYKAVRSASPLGARGRAHTPLWPSQQQQQRERQQEQLVAGRWAAPTPIALALGAQAPGHPYTHTPEVYQVRPGNASSLGAVSNSPDGQVLLQQPHQSDSQEQSYQSNNAQYGQPQQQHQVYKVLAPPPLQVQQLQQTPQPGYNILAPPAGLFYHPPQHPLQEQQQQGYNILNPPPPVPRRTNPSDAGSPPLPSQYDIARQADPEMKARMKADYAVHLQEGWDKQIREKEELQGVLQQSERRWPFGPVGVPMDKRPASAISRPWSAAPGSPGRSPRNRSQAH